MFELTQSPIATPWIPVRSVTVPLSVSRLTVQGALELAVREHHLGRLDDALALYQHVLGVDPSNPDALHLMGMVFLAKGNATQAIGLMERAIAGLESGTAVPPHFRSNLGNAYREVGEFERAETEYRAAIATGGGTPEVFNNLGLTLLSLARPAWAIEAFESSLARRPRHAATLTNLSVACLAAGAAAEALRCADEALDAEPSLGPAVLARASALAVLEQRAEAIDLFRSLLTTPLAASAVRGLSDALFAEGRGDEAIATSLKVAQANASDPTAWMQHGLNLMRLSKVVEAEAAFARVVDLQPGNAAAHSQRGAMLCTLGRYPDAAASLRRATDIDAANVESWANLATALIGCRERDGAVAAAERAASLGNRSAFTLSVLGAALLAARRFAVACDVYAELIQSAPSADAWNGLGVGLERTGRVMEARDAYARAVATDPSHSVARLNHAESLLLLGDYEHGWKAYDVRFEYLSDTGVAGPGSACPRWKPGVRTSDGRRPTVLLIAEQGLGDAIQFVRFAKIIRNDAERVVVQAHDGARSLLATVQGVDEVIGFHERRDHDFAIHAMSVPGVLGTTLETVPADIPYLTPDSELFNAWRDRMGARTGLRVAIAWAGSPTHSHDASRSMELQMLEPLAGVSGVQWFSVQKGAAAGQLDRVSPRWRIVDLGSSLHDLADTAAVLAHVDLVITVDTSVAHLAGAIGARTWTLLSHPPEWRWLLERRDTPWYPTMTLFRQREVDQWAPVVARVRHRLERLVRSKVN